MSIPHGIVSMSEVNAQPFVEAAIKAERERITLALEAEKIAWPEGTKLDQEHLRGQNFAYAVAIGIVNAA